MRKIGPLHCISFWSPLWPDKIRKFFDLENVMDFLYELILLYKLRKKKFLRKWSVESEITINKNLQLLITLKSPAEYSPDVATSWFRKLSPSPFQG